MAVWIKFIMKKTCSASEASELADDTRGAVIDPTTMERKMGTRQSSSRTGLLPSSPLRTVHESFPSHSSSPSNASVGETRFRDRNALTVNLVMALWMK